MKRFRLTLALTAVIAGLALAAPAAQAAPAAHTVTHKAGALICDGYGNCLGTPGVGHQVRTNGLTGYGIHSLGSVGNGCTFSHAHWNSLFAGKPCYQLQINNGADCLGNFVAPPPEVVEGTCTSQAYQEWVAIDGSPGYLVNVRGTDLQDSFYPTATVMGAAGSGNQPVYDLTPSGPPNNQVTWSF